MHPDIETPSGRITGLPSTCTRPFIRPIVFARFLELFGADPAVVKEVRREQELPNAVGSRGPLRERLEPAVERWLKSRFPDVARSGGAPHFFVTTDEGIQRGVYVYPVYKPNRIHGKLVAAFTDALAKNRRNVMVVLGAQTPEGVKAAMEAAQEFRNSHPSSLMAGEIVVGAFGRFSFAPIEPSETSPM